MHENEKGNYVPIIILLSPAIAHNYSWPAALG